MSVSLTLLSHFDVSCDLLLNRHAATWKWNDLFVLYNKEVKKLTVHDIIYASVVYRLSYITGDQSKRVQNLAYCIKKKQLLSAKFKTISALADIVNLWN